MKKFLALRNLIFILYGLTVEVFTISTVIHTHTQDGYTSECEYSPSQIEESSILSILAMNGCS